MNTKNLKAYAPKARRQFIAAIEKRVAQFGIYVDVNKIEPVEFQGGAAMIAGRAYTRRQGQQREQLVKQIKAQVAAKNLADFSASYHLFIRQMAYTWFNRFAALRYLELHEYLPHGFRVLSNPVDSEGAPEILNHAGDVAESLNLDKSEIIELQLAGDKEEALYQTLLLAQCHHLHQVMPFMFEPIDDASELLLPDNLTKTDSILKSLVNDIPEEDWQQIEVIGWLYQFYISEHKDAVIGKVVRSEDIPAATQLFTPNWIVKYLVQNSLGRQWLATYPDSGLKAKMEYYIEPAEQSDEVVAELKAITPDTIDPEQLKILDPAAGSGHILVEVYDVLREIYLERGYRSREIPELILTKNIFGLDIDDRAAQLAGFALMMKARQDDRRIFDRVERGDISLNVYSLQSSAELDSQKLWQQLNFAGLNMLGDELFAEQAQYDPLEDGEYGEYFVLLDVIIDAFQQAKTLGSLIDIEQVIQTRLAQMQINITKYERELNKLKKQKQPLEQVTAQIALVKRQVAQLEQVLAARQSLVVALIDKLTVQANQDTFTKHAVEVLTPLVQQAWVLMQKYDVVVANPPYLGNKGMNNELRHFAKSYFPNTKSDLFAMFMERAFALLTETGDNAQINMQSWMFLNTFLDLRSHVLDKKTILGLVQIGFNSFPELNSKVVQCSCWVISNVRVRQYRGSYINLNRTSQSADKGAFFLNSKEKTYSPKQELFKNVSSLPIAYWVSNNIWELLETEEKLGISVKARRGLETGNNEKFLKNWFEIDYHKFSTSPVGSPRYYPYHKGGEARKWFPCSTLCVDWLMNGQKIKEAGGSLNGSDVYFQEGITWSGLTSGNPSFRFSPSGYIFDSNKGPMLFPDKSKVFYILGILNSIFSAYLLNLFNPTLSIQNSDIDKLLLIKIEHSKFDFYVRECIALVKSDWERWELSWDFNKPILLNNCESNYIYSPLEELIIKYKKLNGIEEKLDEIVFSAIKVQPQQRNDFAYKRFINLKALFDRDILVENNQHIITSLHIASLISYTIGCMMGRYSLDREGLVYAHSGNEGFQQLVEDQAYKTFPADDDGIIPLSSEAWFFDDDATARFAEFVKVVWGQENLQQNLTFVAESLCLHALKTKKDESAMATIRRYFSTQFFKDHCKTYKKRPIYWLFSSGKEKAFECLVYLHRYREGTLSRMRTEYVTPLMGKYEAQRVMMVEQMAAATGAEARRLEKSLKLLEKKQLELTAFDEQLKHYAEKRIVLDLDDGVKVNYGKFGNLLADVKAIHGKAVS